jgi:O-antigen polymerase
VAHLIALSPWTGWGWGNLDYAHYVTLYPGERFCDILDNAHNLPLHLAVELGIPVALVACCGLAWLVLRAAPWKASRPDHRLSWTVLAIVGLHSLVEYPLWYAPFHTAAALAIVTLAGAADPRTTNVRSQRPVLRIALALLLCGAIAWVWRDYTAVSEAYLPYEQRNASTRDQPAHVPSQWSPFRDHALFAAVTTTAVRDFNAAELARAARQLLHYSPEPRVVEILIETLAASGQHGEAAWHAARYKAAFPEPYSAWEAGHSRRLD